jgi:hypothetical protein
LLFFTLTHNEDHAQAARSSANCVLDFGLRQPVIGGHARGALAGVKPKRALRNVSRSTRNVNMSTDQPLHDAAGERPSAERRQSAVRRVLKCAVLLSHRCRLATM